jgi:hypothetical protein
MIVPVWRSRLPVMAWTPLEGGPTPSFVPPVEHSHSSMSVNRTIGWTVSPSEGSGAGPTLPSVLVRGR